MQRRSIRLPTSALATLAAVVMSSSVTSGATTCPAEQVAPASCLDGQVRKIGNLLVMATLQGEAAIIQFDPAGTEADVFGHARWTGYGPAASRRVDSLTALVRLRPRGEVESLRTHVGSA